MHRASQGFSERKRYRERHFGSLELFSSGSREVLREEFLKVYMRGRTRVFGLTLR